MSKELTNQELIEQFQMRLESLEKKYREEKEWILENIQKLSGVRNEYSRVYFTSKNNSRPKENNMFYGTGRKLQFDEKVTKNPTILEKLTNILEVNQTPMTSRELMNYINESKEGKKYIYSTFSGMLSQMYKKKKSKITMYEVEDAPIQWRYFYILKSWKDQYGKLKTEYKIKLENRLGESLFK